jgi:hypothetical protein
LGLFDCVAPFDLNRGLDDFVVVSSMTDDLQASGQEAIPATHRNCSNGIASQIERSRVGHERVADISPPIADPNAIFPDRRGWAWTCRQKEKLDPAKQRIQLGGKETSRLLSIGKVAKAHGPSPFESRNGLLPVVIINETQRVPGEMNQTSFGQDESCEDRIGFIELDIDLDDRVISAQFLSGPLEVSLYLVVDGDITG